VGFAADGPSAAALSLPASAGLFSGGVVPPVPPVLPVLPVPPAPIWAVRPVRALPPMTAW